MNRLKPKRTRFRAYQIGVAGSSFSYYADGHFTLIEGISSELSRPSILEELQLCEKRSIDTLHITSWDQDHCNLAGLEWIFENLSPRKIETPGYAPHTASGQDCQTLIQNYKRKVQTTLSVTVQAITPDYIKSLATAEQLGYREIVYHPKQLREKSNDNSSIKFFRSGSFNVLSLGDVEDPSIAAMLKRCTTLCNEVDVLILAHHGADNGFTTKDLLERLSPRMAVCSSNYDNQFDHPKEEIRDMLYELDIPIYTTKTGDLIVESIGSHTKLYRATNLISNSQRISSTRDFESRKWHRLTMNSDTQRNIANPGFKGIKRR